MEVSLWFEVVSSSSYIVRRVEELVTGSLAKFRTQQIGRMLLSWLLEK